MYTLHIQGYETFCAVSVDDDSSSPLGGSITLMTTYQTPVAFQCANKQQRKEAEQLHRYTQNRAKIEFFPTFNQYLFS